MCIAGPYLYYAVKVHIWGLANKPEGFRFPHILDFWKTAVSTVVNLAARKLSVWLLVDFYKQYAKKQDNEAVRTKYATRCAIYT